MRTRPYRWCFFSGLLLGAAAWADEPVTVHGQTRPSELVWSLGLQLNMDDMSRSGQASLHPMIGLRYGRWRTGVVDGENWHRFGQIKTDNNLTYDWLDSASWRTSFSASIVNMQRDSMFDSVQSGRKTVRGRASIDYLGWSHWSAGLVTTQDLLGRGAGTALSPSVTYRQALTDDSTILISQSLTWSRSDLWRLTQASNPDIDLNQGSGWTTSMDTNFTLRQRWKAHWSWFAQISRSQALKAGDPSVHQGQTTWAGRAGVVYFQH